MKIASTRQSRDASQVNPEDALWSSRCWFWRDQSDRHGRTRPKNQRENQPLILSGFGVSFRVEGGTLRIRNGFTHYPQKQETFRFFKGDLDLPDRIILIDCTGSISFDVMSLMAEQGVSLIKLDWQGQVICLSSPQGYSAIPFRAAWQRATRANHRLRMNFCNRLIIRKIEASILALEKSVRRSGVVWENAMETAYATLTRLEENPGYRYRSVARHRGHSGRGLFQGVGCIAGPLAKKLSSTNFARLAKNRQPPLRTFCDQ